MNLSKFSSFKNEEYSFNFDDYLNMKEIRNFSNNLMEESKKLISVDDVKVAAFNAARMTRDRILNIPDRVIPQLVGKTNIFEMKEILKAELVKALEELSKMTQERSDE